MAKLTFVGHATVEIQSGDHSVLIDPFISDNPVAQHGVDDFAPDAILLTHGHFDHIPDAVPLAKQHGCPIVAPVELANYCDSQGAPEAVGMNTGGVTSFDFGTVMFTQAFHSSSYDGQYMGQPCGIVLTTHEGHNVYHAGDTALFSDMELIGEQGIDVALLPIGSHFTMDPKAAARAAEFIGPQYVVPIHYNTFPPIEQNAEAFKKVVEERTSAHVLVLEPGESHEF
ncbi:MAG: metal-dependent hydrolase [Candidatus Bipolaricaulia bacterium]